LLIFIVGPKFMDPPLEYGIAVNFGTTDFGSGNIQPKKPIKSQVKEIIKQPEVVESQPEETTPQETKEEVLTQDSEESIAIKKQKEAEAKAEAEAEAEVKQIEKEKREIEEKKKKLDALIGGIGKTDGTDTGSEGDDNQAGDKGQLDGDPYAPSYFGDPGSGGGGIGYGLKGRGRPTKSKVIPECDEEGSVVVEIHVSREGRVINAVPGKRGTTGNICLYDAAKKTALTYKWPSDSKAPSKQVGFVVINFSVSQ
jgi:colicin import membrane protein